MRGRSLSVIVASGLIVSAGLVDVAPARANPGRRQAFVAAAVHHDRSRALRDMAPAKPVVSRVPRVRPLRTLPAVARTAPRRDGALQSRSVVRTALLQAGSLNFDGLGQGFTGPQGTMTVQSAPPDTIGAVGPNHYVQVVNSDLAIFSKTGTVLYGPVPTNTLWSGFGGGCQSNNDGDGGVAYDRAADRWIIHQFSVSTTPYLECVAVSQTADPTGAYYRYAFSYGNSDFPDYPKLAVWSDGYYVTFNIFASGSFFAGARTCAYDKAKMLAGLAATQQCFNTSNSYGGALAATVEGPTPPPAGEAETVLALDAGPNSLAAWKFHVDWTTPANSTFTGPTSIATAAFSEACGGGTCIPQTGTTTQLDSLADRLMNRLVYRNFGDHEALVVNHSVTAGSGNGVRWYELRLGVGGALSIFQQGTYAPDAASRWMGSIAFDGAGDIAAGYSESSSSVHPGIRISGRSVGDVLGAFTQPELTMITGAGSQTGSLTRWGDYSQITVDPVDDCTFWYTNEYIPANGSFNWKTRIGTFKFSECPAAANDFSISATPPSLSIAQGGSAPSTISTAITNGSSQTIALSISGLPAGVTGGFSPATISAGGSSTLTVNVAGNTPTGAANLTVTGTGTSVTHQVSVPLTITAPSTGLVVNGGFETGLLTPWKKGGTVAVVAGGHSGAYQVQTGTVTVGTAKTSNVNQTLTLLGGAHTLTLWYQLSCPDVVKLDWARVTVHDNTAKHTYTALAKTCTNDGLWHQLTYDLTPMVGHQIKITLTSHDDLVAGNPTYAYWDDVSIT